MQFIMIRPYDFKLLLFATVFIVLFSKVVGLFPVSKITSTTDYRFYPLAVHPYPDVTVVVLASTTYKIDELGLHPQVKLPENRSEDGGENFLVFRMHRYTGIVRWARIISGFENNMQSDVDRNGNIYLAAYRNYKDNQYGGIVKLSPGGDIIWRRLFSSRFVNQNGVDVTHIRWTEPNTLILPAVGDDKRYRPYAAVLNDYDGTVIRYVALTPPQSDYGSVTVENVDAVYRTACVVTSKSVTFSITANRNRVFLHCFNHRTGGGLKVRELDVRKVTTFPRFFSIALERYPRKGECPALYIAYERVYGFSYRAPEGKSKAVHQLIVQRLCGTSLKDTPWGNSPSTKVLNLVTPRYPDFAIALLGLRYVPRTGSVALLLSTRLSLTGESIPFQSQIKLLGNDTNADQEANWMLFFDERPLPIIVSIQPSIDLKLPKPYNHLIVGDFAITTSSRKAFVMGLLEIYRNGGELGSGSFFTYTLPVPNV